MKSSTDLHWNERAARIENDIEVNIMDIFQRELEYDYVCRYLTKEMKVLEVGCGNGFSTGRFRPLVKHIDAFDYAENMIARAREKLGETNNRFIHGPTKFVLATKQALRRRSVFDCANIACPGPTR